MRYDKGQEEGGDVFDSEGRPLYTTAQAAEMLGVSLNTIQDAIRRGVMVHQRVSPRLTMVTLDAIEAYRRERLGQRGGYRPGAGRRARHEPTAPAGEEGQGAE